MGQLFLFFAEFGKNAASALRMQESDMQTVGTITGSLVDEADALAVAHGECFAHTVFNLEGNMMNALSAVVEELLNSTLRACGFQKFQLNFSAHSHIGC